MIDHFVGLAWPLIQSFVWGTHSVPVPPWGPTLHCWSLRFKSLSRVHKMVREICVQQVIQEYGRTVVVYAYTRQWQPGLYPPIQVAKLIEVIP